jgi:flagellin
MLNNADLEKINNEAQSLIQELDKVAVGTNYNGNPLLDNNGTVTFQVGANNGDTRVVGLVDTRIAELGKAGGQITVSNGANLFDINTDANFTNVDGGATLTHKAGIDMSASISFTSTPTSPPPAAFDGSEELTGGNFSAFNVGDVSTITVTDPNTGATTDLEITVTNNSATVGEFTVKHLSSAGSGVPLNAISMTTQGGAQAALISIDSALTTIQTARSNMGAYQNRFEQVTENLNTSIQNTSAARGRIQDADFAKETAEMTKNQILSQAGVSMLSQANQLPQNVLSLLK